MIDCTRLRDTGYDAVDFMRTAHGRWPLARDHDISGQASEHARDCVFKGVLRHSEGYWRRGQLEDVWDGTGGDPYEMPWRAVRDFLTHAPHRRILLAEDVDRMGFGSYIVEFGYRIYYCVVALRVVKKREDGSNLFSV